ncbi:response regulator [Modestobacter sp. VKM Ac-2978]|uniref:response regulator n=1 Tax=Modestobacter sp. VKM Ac-2978 TaxID=3004132 RepID=UPI0022AADF3F|nr:response regulator [Modestobacter sp. VKM Ac-2978]MCZ2847140.1 response regulator [Modestobacter sp. VKM Ac-2978]
MLTALVIDASPAARQQVTGLLELVGWGVHEAADAEDARWLSSAVALDLVVTSATVPGAVDGPGLLTELRRAGSTAHFLVVTPDPTDEVRAAAAAAGALACLAAPVDARLLVDLVRSRTAAPADEAGAHDLVDVEDLHDADLDADLQDRLQAMYADALPTRLSAISRSVRAGDPRAVADAAHALAGTSGQLGHPEVAGVCQAIAADARRGILAHQRLAELTGLTGPSARRDDARRRGELASAADATTGRHDLAGLVHVVDAAIARTAARRRGLAA